MVTHGATDHFPEVEWFFGVVVKRHWHLSNPGMTGKSCSAVSALGFELANDTAHSSCAHAEQGRGGGRYS
jgi:hypothetical protein